MFDSMDDRKMQRDDDHAGQIAEKLLEGWTLLAEYCPMEGCLAPLMRSRDGRRFCVAHDMYVMSPEEADDMRRQQTTGGGVYAAENNNGSGGSASPKEAAPLERIDFYRNLKEGSTRTGAPGARHAPPRAAAAAAAATATDRPSSRFAGEPMDVSTLGAASSARGALQENVVDVKATAQRTIETLAGKMEEARVILAGSKDFAQSAEIIKFIEQCAAAIKTCEGV